MKKTFFLALLFSVTLANAQQINDSNTPLHLMKPDYHTPYGVPATADIKAQMDKIFDFLDKSTPARVRDKQTKQEITDFRRMKKDTELEFEVGQFRLTSYEWGVTYTAMLHAAKSTGDERYKQYVAKRFKLLGDVQEYFENRANQGISSSPMRSLVRPAALDDAGAMCAAMLQAVREKVAFNSEPMIARYMNYIINDEYRLSDGIFGRNRPLKNTVWLDDMYMSVPAIANMGKNTNDNKYYEETVKQINLFKKRMWLPEKQLFRHGWVEGMSIHPSFCWARANGWAILTLTEVLDVMPQDYPGRNEIMELYQQHAVGLLALQSGEGFWHQLLDRNDSYLETSATAIFTYCFARGINNGWLDPGVFIPATVLGWNAVSTQINEQGEVEGTCVGTGMAFDPAFYYYRPIHKYAAHGYGPVLLAGAEMVSLLNSRVIKMNDSAVQYYEKDPQTNAPIFSVDDDERRRRDANRQTRNP
jgi:Predicted unsaturated glucuronyl hydrolase involved in regulation of bacterial surface properties, and related proteins